MGSKGDSLWSRNVGWFGDWTVGGDGLCFVLSFGWRAGLFMALQPRIIACGNRKATFAMAVRFLAGPVVMTAASFAIGLRGTLLHIAIVQVTAQLNSTSSYPDYPK